MKLKSLLCLSLFSLTLLSGCSLFNKDEDSIEVAPLPTVDNLFSAEQVWQTKVGKGTESYYSTLSPVVQDNRVYVASRHGLVESIDLYSGKTIWRVNFSGKRFWLKPSESALLSGGVTVYGNKVYIGSERGYLYALDVENGDLRWKTEVSGEVLSKPAVTGTEGKILVHTSNGRLQALDSNTGRIQWTVAMDTPNLSLRGSSSPVIAHGAAILGDDNGRLNAYFIDNGQIIWQQKISQPKGTTEIDLIGDVDVTPVVVDDTVYAASYNGNLVGLSLKNGQIEWKRDFSMAKDFVAHNGRIFAVDQEDNIAAYSIEAGAFNWKQTELLNRQLTPPVLYQGYIVVGDAEGYLHWIDTLDGAFVSQMYLDGSGFQAKPIVADDFLIIQAKNGKIYAISRF